MLLLQGKEERKGKGREPGKKEKKGGGEEGRKDEGRKGKGSVAAGPFPRRPCDSLFLLRLRQPQLTRTL